MPKKLLVFISGFLLIVGAILFALNHSNSTVSLASPVTDLPGYANNLWFPKTVLAQNEAPNISAKSAYFVEINSGEVLYQKNEHQRLPIASLVKIMTMIVSLENRKLNELFIVSSRAANMEPDKMLLITNEKLSLDELLDGIILVSANDAAEVLAEDTYSNRNKFIKTMNQKALLLGMQDSLFINPTGLEEDGTDQYSCAYDVALMSRFAIKTFPHLLEISSQPHIFIPQNSTHQDYDLYSGINLLTTYPGVIGLKTGFTPEAGLTLVTVAKRGERTILGVLLGSDDRRGEARELLDYSFKRLGIKI